MHNDTAFGREVAVEVAAGCWRPRVSECGHQNIFGNHNSGGGGGGCVTGEGRWLL